MSMLVLHSCSRVTGIRHRHMWLH